MGGGEGKARAWEWKPELGGGGGGRSHWQEGGSGGGGGGGGGGWGGPTGGVPQAGEWKPEQTRVRNKK